MHPVLQDLRYAFRQLRKSPGFTLAAVLTLAIGIGANTAVFSSMDAVVLRPLAVPRLDRVVTIAEQQSRGDFDQVAFANYQDWAQQNHSFEQMAVYTRADFSLTGAGDAAHVQAALTSASFFRLFEAQPLLGWVYQNSECRPGSDAVAVLNYGFWKRRFGADPHVLGRKIQLDQRTYTVIGVLPKTLQYPSTAEIFLPLARTPQQLADRAGRNYLVAARLRDGVSLHQAQAEMQTLAGHLAQAYPATNQGWTVRVEPLLDNINGDLTPLYYRLIMGATLFVLLVVCANVANLQFARGIARRPEIAMRSALGASRWRLLRQLITENVVLSLLGAIGGIAFGALYLHITLVTMPERVARYMSGWSNISLNGRALAFSLLIAVLAGIVAGIAPAIQALRLNLVDQLKAGSRSTAGVRSGRLRHLFAVAQVALAVALVIGAVLMFKGMRSMLHLADVYEPDKVLTFNVTLPQARYDTPARRADWYSASLARIRALPGVTHAEISGALPYSDNGWMQDVSIENRPVVPGKFQSALRLTVSDGYLGEFRIPILAGRNFTPGDRLGTLPVAVVSRRFAARYFAGESPIGHRIRMGDSNSVGDRNSREPWLTIVGISEDAHYSTWDPSLDPAVYMSAAQVPLGGATYAVIVGGDPLALAPAVRRALAAIDPAIPLDMVMTYEHYLGELLTGLKYASAMLAVDAAIALLLATIGIFAVMANLVGERTREIGVRLAMGARREDVLRMILRRAAWLTGIGLAAGLAMAFELAHLAANLLRGVRSDDPVVFGGIAASIAAIALAASWIPARRAARVDPMEALRDE